MSAPATDEGTFDARPLPRLLLALGRERFSGALILTRDRTRRRVLLREGAPVAVESAGGDAGLAAQLRDAGALSAEDHERVTERAAQGGRPEAAVLLELGRVSPRDLLLALREQARRRLLECFAWAEGRWRLEPGEAPPENARLLRLELPPLIHDGLVRHWSPERLLAELAPRAAAYPAPAPSLSRLRKRLAQGPELDAVLDACDGRTSLGDVLKRVASPRALAALWLADATGALEYRDTPRPSEPSGGRAPTPLPEVEIVFEDDAEASPQAGSAARSAASSKPDTEKDDELEALRREVRERHQRLGETDHYAVLGVERDADPAAVKRAYFAAAKRFHPDALASLGLGDLRPQATEVFAAIATAYDTLSDPRRRREYDAGGGGSGEAEADRLANAEALFRKAEILLRGGDFAGALPFLRPAVKLAPEDPAYRSALGWALFKRNPPEEAEARSHLEKAVALDAEDATAHLRLSVVLRALGEEDTAARHRRRAHELDPKVSPR